MSDFDFVEPSSGRWTSLAAVGVLGAIALMAAPARHPARQDLPERRAHLVSAINASFARSSLSSLCDELDRVTKAMTPDASTSVPPEVPPACAMARLAAKPKT